MEPSDAGLQGTGEQGPKTRGGSLGINDEYGTQAFAWRACFGEPMSPGSGHRAHRCGVPGGADAGIEPRPEPLGPGARAAQRDNP